VNRTSKLLPPEKINETKGKACGQTISFVTEFLSGGSSLLVLFTVFDF
jgi:hypothetical protein